MSVARRSGPCAVAALSRRPRGAAVALLAATAAAAAGACGGCGTATSTAQDRARSTVEAFAGACARGDEDAVLGLLAEPTRPAFVARGGGVAGCDALLGGAPAAPLRRGADFAALRVTATRMDGDAATVALASAATGAAGAARVAELQEARGRWRLLLPLTGAAR